MKEIWKDIEGTNHISSRAHFRKYFQQSLSYETLSFQFQIVGLVFFLSTLSY